MRRALALLVLLAACDDEALYRAPATAEREYSMTDCDRIGKRARADGSAHLPQDMPEEMRKQYADRLDRVEAAVAERCNADVWSKEAFDCFTTHPDPQRCLETLTPEQKQRLQDALREAMHESLPAYGADGVAP